MTDWILYGATGFTGKLLAEEAARRGHKPLLAGRSADKLAPLAEKLSLEWATASLEDRNTLGELVRRGKLVLHAAGPFRFTSPPMVAACLEAGAHYLDITGEIPVFQSTFAHDQEARQQGVVLISGVGFDVIPTDCLSALVARRLPGAEALEIAITALSRSSAGTLKSMIEMLPDGGWMRRGGKLVSIPLGSGARRVLFPDRERIVLPIPWGDLETAYHTTGIPDITTYMAFSPRAIRLLRFAGPLGNRLFKVNLLRRLASSLADQFVHGPDEELRQAGRSYAWARTSRKDGSQVQATLETLEPYRFTAVAGVRCVEKLLERPQAGALTPAQAFGADFVLEIEGTKVDFVN